MQKVDLKDLNVNVRTWLMSALFSATLTFGKGCLRLIAIQLADLKRDI